MALETMEPEAETSPERNRVAVQLNQKNESGEQNAALGDSKAVGLNEDFTGNRFQQLLMQQDTDVVVDATTLKAADADISVIEGLERTMGRYNSTIAFGRLTADVEQQHKAFFDALERKGIQVTRETEKPEDEAAETSAYEKIVSQSDQTLSN